MIALLDLWLPILLSAVLVFVASSVIHMLLPIHKGDYEKLPAEDEVLELLRARDLRPGAYMFPMPSSMKEMGSPEMIQRYQRGPVGHMQVRPSGTPQIGKALGQWFAYCIAVAVIAAYVVTRSGLGAGASGVDVFRVTGSAALLGFAFGQASESIWKGQSWGTTCKYFLDGLVYALLTGAAFAWLWPGA